MIDETSARYLGRAVQVLDTGRLFETLAPGGLAYATVMIWLETAGDLASFRERLAALEAARPLAVMVAGPFADEGFYALLEALGRASDPSPHVMTAVHRGPLRESLEALLQATWPSEDRFDAWTSYVVAVSEKELDAARGAVARLTDPLAGNSS